jgi:hypothetical protein
MSYKKTLSEGSTRTPEQQRAVETGSRHAGQKPKPASPDDMGLQPDEAGVKRQQELRKRPAQRG